MQAEDHVDTLKKYKLVNRFNGAPEAAGVGIHTYKFVFRFDLNPMRNKPSCTPAIK